MPSASLRRGLQSFPLLLLASWLVVPCVVFAQTLTATNPAPAPQQAWEIALKTLFPVIMTVASPYLTGWIEAGFHRMPAPIQYLVSGCLSALIGAVAGAIPDFPLGIESGANLGAASGLSGQFLANQHYQALHPATEQAGPPPEIKP